MTLAKGQIKRVWLQMFAQAEMTRPSLAFKTQLAPTLKYTHLMLDILSSKQSL